MAPPNAVDQQVFRESVEVANPNAVDKQVFREALIVPRNSALDVQVFREAIVPGGMAGAISQPNVCVCT